MNEIKRNCYFCIYFDSDDSGDDWGSGAFPICNIDDDKIENEDFPFTAEQKCLDCFQYDFWAVCDADEEIQKLFFEDDHDEPMEKWDSYKLFLKKYQEKKGKEDG